MKASGASSFSDINVPGNQGVDNFQPQTGKLAEGEEAQEQPSIGATDKELEQMKMAKFILHSKRTARDMRVSRKRESLVPSLLKMDALLMVLTILAIGLAVIELEVDMSSGALTAVKALQSFLTFVTILTVFVQELFYRKFVTLHHHNYHENTAQAVVATIINPSFFVQCFVIMLHTPPGMSSSVEWSTVAVFARMYLLLRLCNFHPQIVDSRPAYLDQGKVIASFQAFKSLFHSRPWQVLTPVITLTIAAYAYLFQKLEGPTNEAFETYGNSLWHVFIVVTTVGFGDIYAESDEGRTLTVICAITGLVLATFFLTGVLESLNLDGLEQAATKNAAEKKTGDKIKIAAVSTISTAYKLYRMRVATKKAKKAGNAGPTAQDLKRAEKDFHSSTRKFINYKKKLGVATDMVPTDEKKEVESMGLMVMKISDKCDKILKTVIDKCNSLEQRHDTLKNNNKKLRQKLSFVTLENQRLLEQGFKIKAKKYLDPDGKSFSGIRRVKTKLEPLRGKTRASTVAS